MQMCLTYAYRLPYLNLKMLMNIIVIEKHNIGLNSETKILKVRLYKISFSWDKGRVKQIFFFFFKKKGIYKHNWKFSTNTDI